MNARMWMVIAGLVGAAGVGIGAFGAHGLPSRLEDAGLTVREIDRRMETFQIGVRYHMYHALALLAVAVLARGFSHRRLNLAGAAFLLGTFIFSGFLYAIALTGIKVLGLIVPVGGVLLIAGWLAVAWAGVAMTEGRSDPEPP